MIRENNPELFLRKKTFRTLLCPQINFSENNEWETAEYHWQSVNYSITNDHLL